MPLTREKETEKLSHITTISLPQEVKFAEPMPKLLKFQRLRKQQCHNLQEAVPSRLWRLL